MTDPENKLFYQGEFFKTEPEFWAYVKEFNMREPTDEDFDSLFSMLGRDLWINICMREKGITNSDMRNILEHGFLSMLEKYYEIRKTNEVADGTN